jgi:GR25 family glycosyltransferase involved in LPS biosynthesis
MWNKAICINLDKRKDRWKESQQEFAKLGIQVERFQALTGNNGMQGLHLSNQQIFRENAGKTILVLEDDVVFNRPLRAIKDAINDLPGNWDMLYLGGNPERPQIRFNTWLFHANGILTTHAILYSAKMTQWLADNMGVPEVVDRQNTIDVWFMKEIQPKFNCFIVYPQIAGQRFGYSDICGMDINYKYFNRKSLKFFS